MRPVCLYLGQDHEKSMLRTTSWLEERDMCGSPGTHPQPGSKPRQTYSTSQPTANLYSHEKINVVLSYWVGVGSMQHYWNNSWLKGQMAEIWERVTQTTQIQTHPVTISFPINCQGMFPEALGRPPSSPRPSGTVFQWELNTALTKGEQKTTSDLKHKHRREI